MATGRSARLLLFCLAAALLLVSPFAFSSGDAPGGPRPSEVAEAPRVDPQPLRPLPDRSADLSRLRGAARNFLTAFLRYEVGDLAPTVRRELHRNTAPGFLRELLARRAAPHPAASAPARIARLRITLLSSAPGRALLTGSARRAGHLEQFSFLFEAHRGLWRAVGPGE